MGVHDGHRNRLRARFLKHGLDGMEDHNVLELVLFYARPRCDTNEIAHALLKRFGSLSAVLDAPMEELVQVPGIGENSALLLKLVPQLCARYMHSRAELGETLDSTLAAGNYFLPLFAGKVFEEAWLVALDDKRKILRCVKVGQDGVANAVRVTVRRIITETVNANATGIILAHNHPGGVALPSAGDKMLTRQVSQALRHINVRLLDHIIVADDDFVSMADSGYIELIMQDEV